MRRVRYVVAASLDGYIAGREGEVDWIIMDPDIDFRALFQQFDTILMGRRTFQNMDREGKAAMPAALRQGVALRGRRARARHRPLAWLSTPSRRPWLFPGCRRSLWRFIK